MKTIYVIEKRLQITSTHGQIREKVSIYKKGNQFVVDTEDLQTFDRFSHCKSEPL